MKMGWASGVTGLLASGVLALAVAAGPVSAQDERDDCRCVDTEGNTIENCSCLQIPTFDFSGLQALTTGRPRLGISVDAGQGAERDARGALVTDVLDDGPADRAGIREGDLITSIGGRSLFEPLDGDEEDDLDLDRSIPVQRLLSVARDLEPGDEVEVVYIRDDRTQTTLIEAEDLSDWGNFSFVAPDWDAEAFEERMRDVAERTRDLQLRFGPEFQEELRQRIRDRELDVRMDAPRRDVRVFAPDASGPNVFLGGMGMSRGGLELVEVNPRLGEYFGTSEGALVVDVDDDSALGLEPGDVILSVGDRDASTPGRVYRILGSYGDDEEIRFRVRRDGREMDVTGLIER